MVHEEGNSISEISGVGCRDREQDVEVMAQVDIQPSKEGAVRREPEILREVLLR